MSDVEVRNYPIDSPEIKIHGTWSADPDGLALRLQAIIIGSHNYKPTLKENGHWVLDANNNWFARFDPEKSVAIVSYRSGKTKDFWTAFKVVVETLLK